MGEIKSTLDLVMEKTRNLKLSAEEKQAHKQSEIASRIKGMLQKLQDGILPENQFNSDYERLKTEVGLSDDSPLIDEIFSRLDPAGDAQVFLNVLKECCRCETAPIKSMIDDYRIAHQQAARQRSRQVEKFLAKKYSITGTAVVPNLDADEEWQQQVQDMRRDFKDRLSQAKQMMSDGTIQRMPIKK